MWVDLGSPVMMRARLLYTGLIPLNTWLAPVHHDLVPHMSAGKAVMVTRWWMAPGETPRSLVTWLSYP